MCMLNINDITDTHHTIKMCRADLIFKHEEADCNKVSQWHQMIWVSLSYWHISARNGSALHNFYMKKTKGEVININASVKGLKGKTGRILGLHALNWLRYHHLLYRKGKASAPSVLLKHSTDLGIIGDLWAPVEEVVKVGKRFNSSCTKEIQSFH